MVRTFVSLNMDRVILYAILYTAKLSTALSIPRHQLLSRDFDPDNPYVDWPSYTDLPLDPSYPAKAAWGVWVII